MKTPRYTVGRGQEILGEFSSDEINEGLSSRLFFESDLVYTEGFDNWKKIEDVAGLNTKPTVLPLLPDDSRNKSDEGIESDRNPTLTQSTEVFFISKEIPLPKEVFAENHIEESSELDEVRKVISDWSNSLRFHPLKNFGNLIELDRVSEQPFYHILLKTQFERRIKDMGSAQPHEDQKQSKKPVSLEALDVWECVIDYKTDFTDGDITHDIEETRTVSDCQPCDATGQVDCDECHTEGQVTCRTCDGHGEVKCSDCDEGQAKCPNCCTGLAQLTMMGKRGHCPHCRHSPGYSGEDRVSPCGSCGGSGQCNTCHGQTKVDCTTCGTSGSVTCAECNGNTIVTCYTCKGPGHITCGTCDGKTRVTQCCQVNQRESAHEFSRLHTPTDYSKYKRGPELEPGENAPKRGMLTRFSSHIKDSWESAADESVQSKLESLQAELKELQDGGKLQEELKEAQSENDKEEVKRLEDKISEETKRVEEEIRAITKKLQEISLKKELQEAREKGDEEKIRELEAKTKGMEKVGLMKKVKARVKGTKTMEEQLDGSVVLELDEMGKLLVPNFPGEKIHDVLSAHVQSVLEESGKSDLGQMNTEVRVNREQLVITRVPMIQVKYTYESDKGKKEYELWMNSKTNVVEADDSPLAEYRSTKGIAKSFFKWFIIILAVVFLIVVGMVAVLVLVVPEPEATEAPKTEDAENNR